MSRTIVNDPIASFTSIHKVSQPTPISTISVAHEPVVHQFTATPTSIPTMPTS